MTQRNTANQVNRWPDKELGRDKEIVAQVCVPFGKNGGTIRLGEKTSGPKEKRTV